MGDPVAVALFPFPDLSAHAVTVEVPVIVDESAASNHSCNPVKDFGVNTVLNDGNNYPGWVEGRSEVNPHFHAK